MKVCGCDGGPEIKTYAFLDNGSDTTLCSDSLAQSLGVPPKPIQFSLTSINSEKSPRSGFEVAFNVQSLKGKDKVHLDKVWSVDCLPISKRDIPTEKDIDRWPHLCGIEFPRLDGDEKAVGILIGKGVPEAHWIFEERRGKRKQPYAVRTLLGWTLIGPMNCPPVCSEARVNFISHDREMISTQLKRMYDAESTESLYSTKQAMSIEDHRALAILETSACMIRW